MATSIISHARIGTAVERFTYLFNGTVAVVKPDKGAGLFLHEDFLGDRSVVWVVCIKNDGTELWRHNVAHTIRLTFKQPDEKKPSTRKGASKK